MTAKMKAEGLLRAVFLFPALVQFADAAEIRSLEFQRHGSRYTVRAESYLEAPPDFVFSSLLNYDQFHRLTSGITQSRWLDEALDGLPLAYTRIDSCVLFFCRRLDKVEQVRVIGFGEIETIALAARSDFRYNRTRWKITAADGGTLIGYHLEMEPDFWVPPLIGPLAIRSKARESAIKIARRLEYMARTGTKMEDFNLRKYKARR